MADISVDADQVLYGATTVVDDGIVTTNGENDSLKRWYISGEAISPGMPVHIKIADDRLYQSEAQYTDEEAASCIGVSLCGCSGAGQLVQVGFGHARPVFEKKAAPQIATVPQLLTLVQTSGINVGQEYAVSTRKGMLAPRSEIPSGVYTTGVCVGYDATRVRLLVGTVTILA